MKSVRELIAYLGSWEMLGVVFGVFVSMIWPHLLAVALGATAFFMIVRWNPRHRLVFRSPADGGVLVLLFSALVTWLISVKPEITLPQVLRLLLGIGLYYTITHWAVTKQRIAGLVVGLLLVGVGLACLAPVGVEWIIRKIPLIPPAFYEKFSVLFSDAVHPNVMAGYLLILLPIAIALLLFAWREQNNLHRVLIALAMGLMLAVLALTQSRGAWIAFAVVLGVMLLLRWRRGWIGIGLALLLAGGGLLILGTDGVTRWFTTDISFASLESRIEVWQRALYMFQDFPLGVGMGLFGNMADQLYPFFLSPSGTIPHAHNIFLQVAVDLGLPGLLAWLVIFSSQLFCAWRIYRTGRRAGNGWWAGLGAGLLCSQIALLVHGQVDAVTWGMARPAPLVWALWGTIAAGVRLVEREEPLPGPPLKGREQKPQKSAHAPFPSGEGRGEVLHLATHSEGKGERFWTVATWVKRFPRIPKIVGVVSVGLALIYLIFQGIDAYRATAVWVSTYHDSNRCENVDLAPLLVLNTERKVAFGSFLISGGCPDLAARILPQFTPSALRADLLAYQWGRIAWLQEDERGAIAWWQQSQNVDVLLLRQARQLQAQDVRAAMSWYEAAILSAGDPRAQAEAISAYVENLRGKLSPNEFAERFASLAAALGPETGAGHYAQGQQFLWQGNFTDAFAQFSQAIGAGFQDSETWYLLGETSWNLNELISAEQAYRAALDATIQIPQRRSWYNYRLATLLAKEGRFNEALSFQQEAVRLSDYYVYWDYLAILYARLGSDEQRQSACQHARALAGADIPVLPCEKIN